MGEHRTTYRISALSCYAERILEHYTQGTVHSVYRKTVNLAFGRHILALQAKDSPLSPLSLILPLTESEMAELPVSEDMDVYIKDGCLELGYRFSFAHSRKYELELSGSLGPSALSSLKRNIEAAVDNAPSGGMSLMFRSRKTDLPLIFYAAEKLIEQCRKNFPGRKKEAAARDLSRLLGLGIGLTPSGDDFLCGILAGLILTGQDNTPFAAELKKAIAENLEDTVDISAAFLSCALDGQFSLAVNSLKFDPSPEELRRSFGEIGHSSGFDTLCGVLFLLQLLDF